MGKLLGSVVVLLCLGCVETDFEPVLRVDADGGVDRCEEAAHYVVDDCEVFGPERLVPLANACKAGDDEPWTRCAQQQPRPDCLGLHFCAEDVTDAGADQGNGGGGGDQGSGTGGGGGADMEPECFENFDCGAGLVCADDRCVPG